MCYNCNDVSYCKSANYTNIHSSCSDMFRRNIYIAYNIKQQHHRNLVTGNKQYCNNNLHIHTNSWTMRYNSNDVGYCKSTNNTNIHTSCSDMFRRSIEFTNILKQ